MNYEKLTSDKVNYLIWRYLQEAGFGQAAKRLERDWGVQHHPDDLPFAKYIRPHGLITLIQYGLKLHRIQAIEQPNQPRFFGPDLSTSVTNATDAPAGRTKSTSPPRKIDTSLSTPLSTSKTRGRKPNGATTASSGKPRGVASTSENMDMDQPIGVANDIAVTAKSENHMDIDDEGSDNKVADETLSSVSSPRNGEQSSTNGIDNRSQRPNQEQQPVPGSVPTPTLIHRTSTGTQVDDIIELAPKTTILNTNSIKNTILSHVSLSPSQQTTSHALLAVGGNQFGEIWEITKDESVTGDKETIDQATPVPATRELKTIDLGIEASASLTSLAWNSDGDKLTYSTTSEKGNRYSVIKIQLPLADKVSEVYGPVGEAITDLAWNSSGRYIAGLSSTSILVLDTKTGNSLDPLDTEHILFDLAWVDKETLAVCGNSHVAIATISGTNIDLNTKFSDLAESIEWSKLRYDTLTNSIAVASETSGQLAIIESTGATHQQIAHTSGVRDMIDCPMPNNGAGPRILATSSTEGHVKIWSFDSGINLIQKLEMGGHSQALTLSFNPSKNLLAVADWDKVLFWDTHGIQPKFKWELRRVNWPTTHVNGHIPNGVNGHDHEIGMEEIFELPPILIWEDSGNHLIFAHKEKIAMIDIPT